MGGMRTLAGCVGLAMATAMAIGSPATASAASYPERPIRLVVQFPPGGAADVLARILAPKLSQAMGQTWVVENRGGAGGNIGSDQVAKAAPDGYTVLLGLGQTLTANRSLYKMPFDVTKDLQPVTMVATHEHLLVVHPSASVATLAELVAFAKKNPGKLNYASSGVGGSLHLTTELLKHRAGIDITHVAYKGGGPAVTAALGGEPKVFVGTVASTLPYVKAGSLRALATTGLKRGRETPDIPTVAESGYPGFEAIGWYAIFVPRGTPDAIVERLRTEVTKVVAARDVHEALARQGLDVQTSSADEVSRRIEAETDLWSKLIKDAGIRAE